MDRSNQIIQGGRPVTSIDAARANEYFEQFVNAATLKHILGYYRGLIENLHLKPNVLTHFYPKLRANLTSWRAKALWKKFDARASHKCYNKGKAAANTRVLIIGGGPCGMRAAIEAQLLGAKVVVVEKRDRFSRNNVLHLWPFVIEDLRMLGAKKFFGKFCAGSIDHISIRQLQCILLKVALLLGVEVHTEVSFEKLIEPSATEKTGWRAEVKPSNHPVSHYEFDVIIGADGKRNTLHGFSRKEFRGKLAIAITANFINKKTEAEARVEEISGVAFIFNQKFFKDLQGETRIDLENIVYYKDDTHYFVMTAKKASLLEKGVIKQDLADTEKLLAPENVDKEALQQYAIEAANFSTNYQMPDLEFAVNHYGQPDIAMFDFTSMYAAENASKIFERNGHRLLMILVGDSLLEPFWPTGSGCARGFLSSLDAAWAIRSWSLGSLTPLEVLAERESIYRLLAQTTPDNLNKDWKSYTLDPSTRYPNLNKSVVTPHQVVCLYDTDDASNIEKMKRSAIEKTVEVPRKRRRGNVDNDVLLNWLKEQLKEESDIIITDIGSVFKDGKALCAIIHHYRPDLLDYSSIKDEDPVKNNQLAIDILEKELGIPPVMTGQEITTTDDYLTMATYLTEVYNSFKGEIPHVKHPKLNEPSKIPDSINQHIPKFDQIPKRTLPSKIPKAIKSVTSDKSKCLSNEENPQKRYSHSKKPIKYKHTLKSTAMLNDLAYSSSISTAIYRKSSTIKKSEIEVIFVKPERSKCKVHKKCKHCRSGFIQKKKSKDTSQTPTILRHQKKSKHKTKTSDLIDCRSTKSSGKISQYSSKTQVLFRKEKRKNTDIVEVNKLKKKNTVYDQERTAEVFPSTEQQEINHSIELLKQQKNKKIKNFMTKLLIMKKNINPTKSVLPMIAENEIAETFNFTREENFIPKNEILDKNDSSFETNNEKNEISNESVRKSYDEDYHSTIEEINDYKEDFENEQQFFLNEGQGDESIRVKSSNSNQDSSIKIRLIERKTKNKFTIQQIEFVSSLNQITVSSKVNVRGQLDENLICSNHDIRKVIPDQISTFPKKLSSVGHNNNSDEKFCVPSILLKLDSSELKKSFANCTCQADVGNKNQKFLSKNKTMLESDGLPNQIYSRVSNWISSNDFLTTDNGKADTDADTVLSNSKNTDFTSVSKADQYDRVIVEERTDVIKFDELGGQNTSTENFTQLMKNINNAQKKSVRTLSKFSQYSPFQCSGNLKSASAPPTHFSVIVEGEESVGSPELPESAKMSEVSFKSIKTSNMQAMSNQPSRPSSRHKRHIEIPPSKPCSIDRKTRKRRTLERVGASVEERHKVLEEIATNRSERQNKRRQQRKLQTEQFLKSMQMLQANAKPDSQPFEDYAIFVYRQTAPKFEDRVKDLEKQFTYVPDHENKLSAQASRIVGTDEDLAARIKSLENKWKEPDHVDKKPKDLLRAIGKIETSDWNIKEIEKKIMENKMGKPSKVINKEKVPKWSKEQFVARQTKMEKKHLDRQESAEAKFADIDKTIKDLDQKLKEGTIRQLGTNKVATLTEKLISKNPPEAPSPEKPVSRPPVVLPIQGGSENCHFCGKRVYLMERLSAEGRFFHHACFKCQYCHTQLRLGSYAFDKDGIYGFKFFCLHHFGMIGELEQPKISRKPSQRLETRKSPEKKTLANISGVDLLDRVRTPERVEFANLSTGHISSDQDESLSQMDEDEWTDKNFGASCAEVADSDDDSSSLSDTDSDDEDAYDDALEEPLTKEGTMKWAERWKNSYSRKKRNSDSNGYSSSEQSSYYDSSDDDESETATEGEEEIRARELRKQEVRVEPPVVQTDTGTDTEIISDETSSESSSAVQNSATEISTDSEFAHDDPTPTRELPFVTLNDIHVTKTRGSGGNRPKKIQVKSGYLQKPSKDNKQNFELKLEPIVAPALLIKKPAPVLLPRTEGYTLNRTQSTGGIAAKVSLELKKKYLLGETTTGNIQKSGSASTLDTKFKSFQTTILDCQKLLKPSSEVSASMQTFCNKLNEQKSPILSPQSSIIFDKNILVNTEKQNENQFNPIIPDIIENKEIISSVDDEKKDVFENESEGRPRSPAYETSIIVPQIDWSKNNQSLSSDSLATSESDNEDNFKQFGNIPRVEVHQPTDDMNTDMALDSLCVLDNNTINQNRKDLSFDTEVAKSITSEKKSLNQPKALPNLENMLPKIHNALHVKSETADADKITETSHNSSGVSTPESVIEQPTTALTETELSDWARDDVVSEDFEDVYEPNDLHTKKIQSPELLEVKESDRINKAPVEVKGVTLNFDNIEFMDTGTETSSEDGNINSQEGYVLLKNDDDISGEINQPVNEAMNLYAFKSNPLNTGYCFLSTDNNEKSGVVNMKPSNDSIKQNILLGNDHEEDSLQVTGTTTEENTFSDSTVKNVTEITADKQKDIEKIVSVNNNNTQLQVRKNASENKNLVTEPSVKEQKMLTKEDNFEFDEHCQRLQSRIEFSNARDSIDIRKSRRKSKSEVAQKPDLIQEEKTDNTKELFLNLSPTPHTPDILYNKEIIKKERDVNQKLIQEMVMNKMKAENKSLERKKRNRLSASSISPNPLTKSKTTDISSKISSAIGLDKTLADSNGKGSTPDVLLTTTNIPLQTSKSIHSVNFSHITDCGSVNETPKAPPRLHRQSDDIYRKLNKLEKSVLSKQNHTKSANSKSEKRFSWQSPNDINKKNSHLFVRSVSVESQISPQKLSLTQNRQERSSPIRTKSIPDVKSILNKENDYKENICKSDPNMLQSDTKSRKKSKDRERRKSITKLFATFLSNGTKGLFSKMSPKSKTLSKDLITENSPRRNSLTDLSANKTPPPIPPLPVNYSVKETDESSEEEHKLKKHDSSSETLDKFGTEFSTSSNHSRRSGKFQKMARQSQLKRHRMAQEIQRKLEETEVKTKELERMGVLVEKSLRGEDGGESSKDESELLQEWFDLMRDRTELRRYEKELLVRAQELELEDRYGRLQNELRERLESNEPKSEKEMKREEDILNEMMEIVSKRDSLVKVIEEDRLRYCTEDRDMEEQMLAKGLRLTPIKKSPEK